jgi:hypothetical protein
MEDNLQKAGFPRVGEQCIGGVFLTASFMLVSCFAFSSTLMM